MIVFIFKVLLDMFSKHSLKEKNVIILSKMYIFNNINMFYFSPQKLNVYKNFLFQGKLFSIKTERDTERTESIEIKRISITLI